MGRTKKFLYNSISAAFLQFVIMIVGFIIPRIMLEYYGSEINGLVSSITQFISYFNLVEAGLATSAIYALYKPLADNDIKNINGIVTAAKNFYNLSGYIFTSLTIGLAVIYPFFVKTNAVSPLNVGLLVLVLGVTGAMEFFTMSKYRVLLTADQKIFVISITSVIALIINTAIIIVLSKLRVDIVVLRTVALFSVFARSILLYTYVNLKYKYINYHEEPNYKALSKRWDALYLQILGSIQFGIPVVYATLFTNLKIVSIYAIYNMVISGINGLLSMFISGLSASFGDIIARKDLKLFQKTSSEFEFIYYSLITIIYSTTMILYNPFIKIYTRGITDTNYNLPLTGFLFVLNGILYNLKTPQGMLVVSAGMFKETRMQTTIQALIIIITGIVLIHYWGLNGMLLASILSNLYRDIDLMIFIPKYLTKLPVKSTAFKIIKLFILSSIIWFTSLAFNINPTNYFSFFGIAICIIIYSTIIVAVTTLIFDRDHITDFVNRIKLLKGST